MQTIKYVHWQEDDAWLGYLEEYPDYWTQGDTLADLVEHLKDLIFVERATFFLASWSQRALGQRLRDYPFQPAVRARPRNGSHAEFNEGYSSNLEAGAALS
jgi:hypothetical protein